MRNDALEQALHDALVMLTRAPVAEADEELVLRVRALVDSTSMT